MTAGAAQLTPSRDESGHLETVWLKNTVCSHPNSKEQPINMPKVHILEVAVSISKAFSVISSYFWSSTVKKKQFTELEQTET